jgi:hypothetical protein
MNKILLAVLSGLLISSPAYADKRQTVVKDNVVKLLSSETITPQASMTFLKNNYFNVDKNTFATDATIIHSKLHASEESGQPFLFAFNEGNRIVGVASTYDDSNKKFFNKLAKLSGITCVKLKSRFDTLATCYKESTKQETVKKFKKDFRHLMENAG